MIVVLAMITIGPPALFLSVAHFDEIVPVICSSNDTSSLSLEV